MKNRIAVLAVCLLLILSMTATVQAATHPVPDLSRNGSLTFQMEIDGEKLNTGALNIYRVGDLTEEDGNYFFTLLDGTKITEDAQVTQVLAEQMLALARDMELEALSADVRDGLAVFPDLQHGLYVVWQMEADACEEYAPISPFLISIPQYVDGEYVLDVVAKPKVPFSPEPPTPPTEPPPPPPPELPQTGQLNWPIPVMAVSGVVLVIIGWILCASRKRCGYEK